MLTRSLSLLLLGAAAVATAQDRPGPQHPALQSVERLRGEVTGMRGLEFKAHVRVGVKTAAELRALVLSEFEEEEPAAEMAKQEKVYKRFGLLPADYDLRARMIDFMSEHIGGYYDPEEKELFLVDHSQAQGPQGLQGFGGGMQAGMDEMVLAHELHHALQDQHFDLMRWTELLADHDDRSMAYDCLVEGEAQVIGLGYLFKRMGQPGMSIRDWNRMEQMAQYLPIPEAQKLREVPPFLLENMMFPYTQGAEFVEAMKKARGWEYIGASFHDPPSSTEQVLHPEKFFGPQRDEPMELLLPDVARALGKGAAPLLENTLGEFNVSLLLRALGVRGREAARAAAGWDGDRFSAHETGDGRVVIVWLSTWDSEAEATEFEATYRKALKGAPDRHLERRGQEVLLVDGASDEERAALVRKGFAAIKYEPRFQPLPGLTAPPPVEDFARGAAPAPEVAPAPAGPTLVHADSAGVTFLPPAGWTLTDEPLEQLRQFGAVHLQGPSGGARTRLIRLPITLAEAEEQLPVLLAQGVPDGEVRAMDRTRVLGRDAVWMDLRGTLPGEKVVSRLRVLVFDQGMDALAVGTSIPEGEQGSPQRVIEELLPQLWLDGTPAPGARRVQHGPVAFEEPAGFVATAGRGPVLVTFEHPGGAKVQVVRGAAQGALLERARALEAQLPLLLEDFRLRSSGVVTRRKREAHELDFDAAGRRTRQLTVDLDGERWTVACSAPADAFTDHAPAFGRVLASFGPPPAAPPSAPAPQAPETPKPERKAY